MTSNPVRESGSSSTSQELDLRLYVAGGGPNSSAAVANLRSICDRYPTVRFNLEVVDLLLDPQRALSDEVYVTPLLLKLSPQPACRVVGTLTDLQAVCSALGLQGGYQ